MLDPIGATGPTLEEASNPHDIPDAADEGLHLQRFVALLYWVPALSAEPKICS